MTKETMTRVLVRCHFLLLLTMVMRFKDFPEKGGKWASRHLLRFSLSNFSDENLAQSGWVAPGLLQSLPSDSGWTIRNVETLRPERGLMKKGKPDL